MQVLYVSQQLGPHDRRFLDAIVEAGHQPYFANIGRPAAASPDDLPPGTKVAVNDLQIAIAQIQPDLIHASPLHTGGYLAAQTKYRPLVAMSWGSDILHTARRNVFARRRVAAALRGANALIADCEAVASAAVGMGYPRQRIVVFPWGVDLARFHPSVGDDDLRQQLGWQDSFVLLHLRAWEPLYGSETVLRAFFALAPAHPSLRLLMPGAGRLAPRFQKLIQSSGFADRIHLPGALPQNELPAYYNAADLYLSASHSDGSSVSLMEALASGLPALVSDIPGNREWVNEGVEGWLFPVGDQAALADKIRVAVQTHNLADLAANARRTAEARADWTRNKLGLSRAYELALT